MLNLHLAAGYQRLPMTPSMATVPTYGLRLLNSGMPRLQNFFRPSIFFSAVAAIPDSEESQVESPKPITQCYFPKRGQKLELVCESLAFKGKGVCKVADTGFVVLCDRALPGERFVGRVTRKKGNYAEVGWNCWFLVPCCFLLIFNSIRFFPLRFLGNKSFIIITFLRNQTVNYLNFLLFLFLNLRLWVALILKMNRWLRWRQYLLTGTMWMPHVNMHYIVEVVRRKIYCTRPKSEQRSNKFGSWWYMLESFLIKILNSLALWSKLFLAIFNFIIEIR